MRRNQNISSHAVGQRSQSNDNFTSHFEEVSQIPDNFDSQTYTNILQESSVLGSCSLHRQLNEHYQSNHHNNQVPTDQFVMNRPDVAPTSRHVFVDPITNRLNLPRYNANSNRALVPAAESSATNNSRMDHARSRVPRLHQSSSQSGREVVEQEDRQNTRDHPRLIRPTPYRLYDPSFSMRKAASNEISTTNNIRTDYARSRVPRLHQSSSHSGREVVEQEHRQSRRDHPQVFRPIINSLYDPHYAAIGQPVDPILRVFTQNPNFSMPKATSDESSTTNNTRREVVEQEHTQSRRDYPQVIRRIPNRLYDPRYAAIGLPVDPLLRAFELNPNWGLSKRDE